MQPDAWIDAPPPYNVSMHVRIEFRHEVTMAENMDAATALVKSQVEMLLNKARREAQQLGIEIKCDYMVTY